MIDAVETGSGPGAILYACPPCSRVYARTPMAPEWLRASVRGDADGALDGNLDGNLDGLRIDRVPTKKVRVGTDGRVTVPLWLHRDHAHHADLDLTLTRYEAAALYAQLGQALEGATGAHRA